MREDSYTLIVDDSQLIREVIKEYLGNEGYKVCAAADGIEALDILRSEEYEISVIILDWEMPKMDGMTFLHEIKKDKDWRLIPVVMQTSRDSEEDVLKGIEAGVYYYLQKPVENKMLLSLVRMARQEYDKRLHLAKSAVADKLQLNMLLKKLTQKSRSLNEKLKVSEEHNREMEDHLHNLISESPLPRSFDSEEHVEFVKGTIEFRTIREGDKVAKWLSRNTVDREETMAGLVELFTNAVEHGNLKITYEDKSNLLKSETWEEEIQKRLDLEENQDKRVKVEFEMKEDVIDITIIDCGDGFEFNKYLDLTYDRAFDLHGRGIFMTKNVYLKNLSYIEPGNMVKTSIELKPKNERED